MLWRGGGDGAMTRDETGGRDNREGGGAYGHSRILGSPVAGPNKALTVHRIAARNDTPMTLPLG
jgi:hypothetical protein